MFARIKIRLGRLTLALAALVLSGVVVSGLGTSTNFTLTQETNPTVAQDAYSPGFRLIGAIPGSAGGDIGISAQYRMHFDDLTPTSFLPDDLTPPVITAAPVVTYVSSTIALVEWTTDEPSSGVVNFGLTPAFGATASHAGFSTLHQVLITTGLAPSTFYFFQAQSTDPYANGPTSSTLLDFTTTAAPDVQSPVVTSTFTFLSISSVRLDFTIDEMAQTTLRHGPTPAVGTVETDVIWRNSRTRTLTGLTPGGSYYYALDATDPSGNVTTGTPTLITLPAAVAITTIGLPNGKVKNAYFQTLVATGGQGTRVFTIASGTLPPGLTLAPNGTVSGTPYQAGTFLFVLQVTDSGTPASVDTQALQIIIDKESGDDDSGCSTGEGQFSWLLLAGVLASLALALRRGRQLV